MADQSKFSKLLGRIVKEKSSLNADVTNFNEMSSDPKKNKLPFSIKDEYRTFDNHSLWLKISTMKDLASRFGIEDPFFKMQENVHGTLTTVRGKECINFSSYNYLGFNDHPELRKTAMAAVESFGTSVGASRLVAGEREFQKDLECKIASFYRKPEALVFVSGHATNVSTISTLFGSEDLIVYDSLCHNSIIEGILLSGARYFPFAHNDLQILEKILMTNRSKYKRVLIVTEGLFSMDGDVPNLPELIVIKEKFGCILMIDEAHSLGVLGKTGHGLFEHWAEINTLKQCSGVYSQKKVNELMELYSSSVDIWMGTLSKTLASCGGYIAADSKIISILRFYAPGFVYSVGISAPAALSANKAFELMEKEPERIYKLRSNAQLFRKLVSSKGINTGRSEGFSVIPVIIGSSHRAIKASEELWNKGINVQPIIHPAVEEQQARLRFFITSEHTVEQIVETTVALQEVAKKIGLIK